MRTFYTKRLFLEIEVFAILIILWKYHRWPKSSLFYVSELKRSDKVLVMLYLSEHFHQKVRQHAIVIAGTTLHL